MRCHITNRLYTRLTHFTNKTNTLETVNLRLENCLPYFLQAVITLLIHKSIYKNHIGRSDNLNIKQKLSRTVVTITTRNIIQTAVYLLIFRKNVVYIFQFCNPSISKKLFLLIPLKFFPRNSYSHLHLHRTFS